MIFTSPGNVINDYFVFIYLPPNQIKITNRAWPELIPAKHQHKWFMFSNNSSLTIIWDVRQPNHSSFSGCFNYSVWHILKKKKKQTTYSSRSTESSKSKFKYRNLLSLWSRKVCLHTGRPMVKIVPWCRVWPTPVEGGRPRLSHREWPQKVMHHATFGLSFSPTPSVLHKNKPFLVKRVHKKHIKLSSH